jgi:hypothetical protein
MIKFIVGYLSELAKIILAVLAVSIVAALSNYSPPVEEISVDIPSRTSYTVFILRRA